MSILLGAEVKIKTWSPIITLLVIVLMVGFIKYLGVFINVTPSMPLGIYVKRSSDVIYRGDIVAFCLPDAIKSNGIRKGYLQKGRVCKGSDPLIKEVIAIPGDHVVLSTMYIDVNGHRLRYTTVLNDQQGRALSVYPRGEYSHTSGYWLIGTNAVTSWDSRYWGPIEKAQVLSTLRPWLLI